MTHRYYSTLKADDRYKWRITLVEMNQMGQKRRVHQQHGEYDAAKNQGVCI